MSSLKVKPFCVSLLLTTQNTVWFLLTNVHHHLLFLLTIIVATSLTTSFTANGTPLNADPPLLYYPGDLNIGLLINLRNGTNCESPIQPGGLQRVMAAVWTIYQVNLKKRSSSALDFGLYIYDTCSDPRIAQRQTVRLLSYSEDVPGNVCQKSEDRNPLIGVVTPNKVIDASLNLLRLFNVPVILTEEPVASLTTATTTTFTTNIKTEIKEPGNVFTVAPSLKYLSKAVLSLAKRLKWIYSSMVISDDIPQSLSNIFIDSTKSLHETLTPNSKTLKYGGSKYGKNGTKRVDSDSESDADAEDEEIKTDQVDTELCKNTIFFLSSNEALRLVQSLQRSKSSSGSTKNEDMNNQKDDENGYSLINWIVVTSADISEKLKSVETTTTTIIVNQNNQQSTKKRHKVKQKTKLSCRRIKPMFFFYPRVEATTEFQAFFESEVLKRGIISQHPLIREFTKNSRQHQQRQHSNQMDNQSSENGGRHMGGDEEDKDMNSEATIATTSVTSIVKAMWSIVAGARKLETKYCPAYVGKSKCSGKLRGKLSSEMTKEIRELNSTLATSATTTLTVPTSSGLRALDSFRLNFDEDQILQTNKYTLSLLTHDCKLVEAGYYSYSSGLVVLDGILDKVPDFKKSMADLDLDSEKTSKTKERAEESRGHSPTTNTNNNTSGSKDSQKKLMGSDSEIDALIETLPSVQRTQSTEATSSVTTGEKGGQTTNEARRAAQRKKGSKSGSNKSSNSDRKGLEEEEEEDEVTKVKQTSFTTWLGSSWAFGIVGSSIFGALVSLYFFIFLLMKACEGAFRKSNQDLVTTHLIAIVSVFFAAALYVFQPTPFMCSVRTSVHNVALSLLFGSLLQRAMHLRSQKWIGLGGKLSQLNQCLTLCFIIGVQLALEIQRWRYEKPPSLIGELTTLPNLCSLESNEFVYTQIYLIGLLILLVLTSFSTRKQPFTFKEGQHLFLTTLILVPIYATVTLFITNFTYFVDIDDLLQLDSNHNQHQSMTTQTSSTHTRPDSRALLRLARYRDILISLSMLSTAIVTLLGIFGPIVYTIHKYGVLPRKAGSYAESLSTAFTLFNGSGRGGNGCGGGGANGTNNEHHHCRSFEAFPSFDSCVQRGEIFTKTTGRNKPIKSPESTAQVLNYVLNGSLQHKPNFQMECRHSPSIRDCCLRRDQQQYVNGTGRVSESPPVSSTSADQSPPHISELFRNPLYEENNGFRSAYP